MLAAFAAEVAVGLPAAPAPRGSSRSDAPAREADRMRTALLNAVSHDLRSPLAVAKATVTSLRSADIDWPEATASSCSPAPMRRSTGSPNS